MMYTLSYLPETYIPLESLIICSNKLLGGGFAFSLGEGLPLIVGQGTFPTVWLQGAVLPGSKELITLIDNNVSLVESLVVSANLENRTIEVIFNKNIKVIEVKLIDEKSAEITYLDLKPLGFNIFGNRGELHIGSSNFSRNTIHGTNVFLGLG